MKTELFALLAFFGCIFSSLSAATTYSGKCGTNVSWQLDTSSGILRIFGTGKMNDYALETSGSNQAAPYRAYSSYIRTLQIEEGVTYVGTHAFYHLPIYYIYFPTSLKKIGNAAFHGRDNTLLQEVHYPDLATLLNMDFTPGSSTPCSFLTTNPLFYSPQLFIGEEMPTVIEIPDTYSEIKNYTFIEEYVNHNDLFQVTTIHIPSSIVKIGAGALMTFDTIRYGGTLLEWCKIERGNTIGTQYECAQRGICRCNALYISNEELQNLVIPEEIASIGKNMFSGCKGLKSITLPKQVSMIDYHAFYECTNLNAVYVENPVPPSLYAGSDASEDYIFGYENPKDLVVYIPKGKMTIYNKTSWSKYNLIEKSLEDVYSPKMSDQNKPSVFLRDGQIFILRGDKTYTLTGQEVK